MYSVSFSFPPGVTSWCLCTMFTFILIFCVPKKFMQCVWFLDFWSLLYHYQTFANPILWHCVCLCGHHRRRLSTHSFDSQCEKYDSNIWLGKVELVWQKSKWYQQRQLDVLNKGLPVYSFVHSSHSARVKKCLLIFGWPKTSADHHFICRPESHVYMFVIKLFILICMACFCQNYGRIQMEYVITISYLWCQRFERDFH